MSPFQLQDPLPLEAGLLVSSEIILKLITPLLTTARQEKIDRVARHRNFSNALVLEGIYDRGNVSAVMRTAEALGFVNFHIIETQTRFKEANRVTQGADKWTEVEKWSTTRDCITTLKKRGHRIIVTSLEASKPIHEVDFSTPTALVLGNEKEGISQEMKEIADERIILPMQGFVQSYNISVAGALSLYHIYQQRMQKLGRVEDVTHEQIQILKAHYALRTQDSSLDILKRHFNNQSLS
ncbi:MAG: TrmH family RNA methyltransferase [Bdellovibrionales bacterium]